MIALTPDMDGRYPASPLSMQLFGPGAPLSVSATGDMDGGVPAFTGMVTSASPATLTTPAISDGTPLSVPAGFKLQAPQRLSLFQIQMLYDYCAPFLHLF
jgi:hypothetical protein